ncbi:LysR family transcriptional regulator [Amycolatopsis jejuensis]|uniref:LysR family transcriptional regulator n=1 Tax=Amycolatopsis jejuensis TaxID=330084 RepID=UPI00052547A9|nr:LysR family transcriptional regulator [Amycolatopsis jejuensis]
MADFTLAQLRYFVVAASSGSMTAAAAELRIAQSAVSSAVATLERALGVQLFIRRHARGLCLTDAGERLCVAAQDLLAHATELGEVARGIADAVSGDIRFGCFVTLAPFLMPQILRSCADRYPQLHIQARELDTDELLAELKEGKIEVALMYDLGLGEDLKRRRIAAAPPYVIVPAGHPLSTSPGIHLAELEDEPMIILDIPRSAEYFEGLLHSAGVEPKVCFRSSSYETVRGMVAEGLGYAVLNQRPSVDTTYGGRSVVAVPLLDELSSLPIVLTRLTKVRPTGRAQALADACAAALADRG